MHPPDPLFRRCTRCVYDVSVAGIAFDEKGVCNYCQMHDRFAREYPAGAEGRRRLESMAGRIRAAGRGRAYDVVVGVSGGCDSSYMLYLAKELGLRPLAVHFDNTWDSEIAVRNIRRVLKSLDVDLYTYVVDNEEFDDIYRSFMLAGVRDIDIPTDIALAAVLNIAAEEHGIRHIFEGHSFRTEGVTPLGWVYMDARYIKSVHDRFGTRPMRTFPNLWLSSQIRWMVLRGIRKIRPLYYMEYQKQDVMQMLSERLGWQWYGGHHLENRLTAFYHSFLLPRRFGIDSRLLGHAALVRTGQLERDEALRILAQPQEHDSELVAVVKKRLGFSEEEFERIMTMPRRTYLDFPTYTRTFRRLRWFFWLMYKMDRIPKSFYVKFAAADHRTLAARGTPELAFGRPPVLAVADSEATHRRS